MNRFSFAVVAALLPLPGLAQDTQEERDVGWIQGLIEDNLSGAGRTVIIEGFDGALSSRATIASMTIADDQGVWLRAEGLVFDWTRSALLGGEIDVQEMSADVIEFVRPPVGEETVELPDAEATPFEFALPELPVGINIDKIEASRIILGAPLLGEELAFSVDGTVSLSGGEGSANIVANRLDGAEGRFEIAGAYSNSSRILSLTTDLSEAESGIIARVLDLPGAPSVDLSLSGEAPIDDYAADLRIATAGIDRIVGSFGFISTDAGQDVQLDIQGDVNALIETDYADFFGDDVRLALQGNRDADGALSLEELLIEAQSLSLNGSAEIGADGWPLELSLNGRLAAADGSPVLLPAGTDTTLRDASIGLTFDAAAGDVWSLNVQANEFVQPGLSIDSLGLNGTGLIRPGASRVDGMLDYDARGLSLADVALAEALGTTISGQIAFVQEGGAPFEIPTLTLTGPGLELAAETTVDFAQGGVIDTSILLEATELARFGALSGLNDLTGMAELIVIGQVQPLDGMFDLSVFGNTEDLALGIAAIDPHLTGSGEVAIVASRDTMGTRIETLDITTSGITATATADITSVQSMAEFDFTLQEVGLSVPDLQGPAQLRGTATVAPDQSAVLRSLLTLPGTTARVDADAAAPGLGGLITLDIAARIDDITPYGVFAGRDLGGAAELEIAGTMARDTLRADLNVTGQTIDLAIDVPQADALLRGVSDLSARVLRVNADAFRVEGLELRNAQVALEADAGLTLGDLTADIDLMFTDLGDVLPQASGPAALSGQVARQSDGLVQADLVASGPGGLRADIEAEVNSSVAALPFAGEVSVQVNDLSPYADLVGTQLGGAVDLRLQSSDLTLADPLASDFAAQFTLQGSELVYGAQRVSGRVAIDGTAAHTDGTLSTDFTATGPGGLDANINALLDSRVDGLPLTGAVVLQATDLGAYSDLIGTRLDGALVFEAEGRTDAVMDVMGAAFEVTFDASGRDLAYGTQGLRGAVEIDGTAARAGDETTANIMARGPGGANIDLAATLSGDVATGDLRASIDSLAPYSDLAGRQLAGRLETDLTGSAAIDASTFDVDFNLSGTDLNAGGIALAGGIDLAGDASRTEDGTTAIDLNGTAPGDTVIALRAAGQDSLQTSLSVEIARLATYAGLIGQPLSGSVSAQIDGTVHPADASFDLRINGTTQNIDPGIAQVATLLRGTGQIVGQVRRDAQGGLSVQGLDVAYPNIAAQADLNTRDGGGGGTFSARLADLGLFVPEFSGPATANGTAQLRADGGFGLDITATGPGGLTADVSGSVASSGTLDLGVRGGAPLALANPFIEPRRVDGNSTFDLTISGPPALSSVSGRIGISEGRLSTPTFGQALENLNGSVLLTGQSATLDIGAALEAGGRITVSGPVGLSGGLNAGLRVAGEGLVLRDPSLYETTVDLLITVTGPLAGGAQIAGDINLGPTEIQVPSSSTSALGPLPQVTHIGAPADVRTTLDRAGLTLSGVEVVAEGGGGPVFGLDVRINAPARVFIRGRGLDAELGGQLRISGDTGQVIPIGEFSLIRGRLDILEQRFDLTEGGAFLQGSFDPFLRLVAATDARDGTEVRIIIEGPATEPEVRFESSPDLPQDEILSRLIFGRDLSEISPLQAIQLAAAVSTLAGRSSGGLLSSFRQDLGLDDLDVVTDEDGNAAVRAGAYISDNVYTDVTVGTENTEINLNLDLTDDITVTGSAGSDGNTSVGVFFERDY